MVFFCVRPENVPMFDGLSFIDEVIAFDKRGVHKGIKGLIAFAKLLKNYRFDYILSCHRHYRTSMLMKLLKTPFKIGFTDSKLSFVYDIKVERPQQLSEELTFDLNKSLYEDLSGLSRPKYANILCMSQ